MLCDPRLTVLINCVDSNAHSPPLEGNCCEESPQGADPVGPTGACMGPRPPPSPMPVPAARVRGKDVLVSLPADLMSGRPRPGQLGPVPELSVCAPRGALVHWGWSPCQPLSCRPHPLCCESSAVLQWSLCSGQRRGPLCAKCTGPGRDLGAACRRPRGGSRVATLPPSGPARPGPSTSRHAVPWSRGVPGPSPRSSGAQTDPPGPRPLLTLHVCTCACSMRDRGPRMKFHTGVGLSNV